MELSITKEDIEEIDYIIDHFLENNKHSTTSFPALALCLQILIEARNNLVKQLEKED